MTVTRLGYTNIFCGNVIFVFTQTDDGRPIGCNIVIWSGEFTRTGDRRPFCVVCRTVNPFMTWDDRDHWWPLSLSKGRLYYLIRVVGAVHLSAVKTHRCHFVHKNKILHNPILLFTLAIYYININKLFSYILHSR